nr:RHS repeat-associated core domain-containing protein [Burkholderia seminalis]
MIARVSKAAGVEPRNPIRFQGQQEDAETGLRYNRHRYYDPSAGRFISFASDSGAGLISAPGAAPCPPCINRLMCSRTRLAKMREAARQFPSAGANDNQESGDSPPWHPPSPTRSRQQAPPAPRRSTPAPSRRASTACRRPAASGSSSCC